VVDIDQLSPTEDLSLSPNGRINPFRNPERLENSRKDSEAKEATSELYGAKAKFKNQSPRARGGSHKAGMGAVEIETILYSAVSLSSRIIESWADSRAR
jgi:hypothetical protein